MSLIPPQRKVERQTVTIKLEAPVLAALKHYGEFLDSSQEHVVNTALRYLFTHDDAFVDWRRSQYPDARLDDEGDKSARSRTARRSTRRADTAAPQHTPEA